MIKYDVDNLAAEFAKENKILKGNEFKIAMVFKRANIINYLKV
jgi:hypothetical protein